MVSEWAEERKLMVIDTNIVSTSYMLTSVFVEWDVRICRSKAEGTCLIISTDAQSLHLDFQDVLYCCL
jgi:hypothetical protein